MAQQENAFVFHLKRKNGNPLFLLPFKTPTRLMDLLARADIRGRYGEEPMVEALTMLRNDLYRMADSAVRMWIGELRFIPRFLISTGVFLVAYFIGSYFIRDPIPLVDELVMGLVAAVIAYVWLGKRYSSSTQAARKRVELRAAIDRIAFTESAFLHRVEALLHDNERSEADAIRQIVSPGEQVLDAEEREEAEHLVAMLESRFDLRKLRREERVLRRFVEAGEPAAREQTIRRWLQLQKLDAPLYAIYKGFKHTVQPRRS